METHEQAAFVRWASASTGLRPELDSLFAIPNGDLRNRIVAARLKREGVRSGVPDLCLPVPRSSCHGLFVEMKYAANRLSPAQKEWAERLTAAGFRVVVAYGVDAAIRATIEYLDGKPPSGTFKTTHYLYR